MNYQTISKIRKKEKKKEGKGRSFAHHAPINSRGGEKNSTKFLN